jgi:hypothetical protein
MLEADRFVADLDERAPDLDNVAGIAANAKGVKSAPKRSWTVDMLIS